ncbi:transferase [Trichoderma barbatum]
MDWEYLFPVDQILPRIFFPIIQQGLTRIAAILPHLTSFLVDDNCRAGNIPLVCGRDTIDNILKNLVSHCPRISLFHPHIPEVPRAAPWPVMRAEVTRTRGVYPLVVLVHHCVFDGVASSELVNLWATCCRHNSLGRPLEISEARLNWKVLLEDDFECKRSRAAEIFKATNGRCSLSRAFSFFLRLSSPIFSKYPQPYWPITLYRLPYDKLRGLKRSLNQFASKLGVRFLSTNDVVSALVWSCATSTQRQRWSFTSHCSTGLSVNFQSRLQPRLPDDFLEGTSFESLAHVAAAIRQGVDGHVDCQEDSSKLKWRPMKLNEFHIASWANKRIYDADWGPQIRKCEALRVAQIALVPMCVILPPRHGLGSKEGQYGDIKLRFRKLKLMSEFAEIYDHRAQH